ncbi:MAG: phosphomannomutase/phosphoglucomutase [Candidatus Diapherotrites archaeon]|nr:phosphomannomutase/phosphoglucomutase [Candidatus Diapherotrites archaeon]
MLPRHVFREYDVRGLAESELPSEGVCLMGQAFGSWMQELGILKVVVGQDNRVSSSRIAQALVKGILSSGCSVVDVGVVPTPVLNFAVLHLRCGAGINVTASHNPGEFNGFKFSKGMEAFYGKELQELRRRMEQKQTRNGNGVLEKKDVLPDYLNELRKRFHFSGKTGIVIDCGNGAACLVAPRALKALGVQTIELFCEPDGAFPNHLPDPTVPELMKDLSEKVRETNAAFGIGFDGDMDRIGVVDARGELIWGDRLLAVYAMDLLSRHKGAKIVFDVKCSNTLIETIGAHQGTPLMNATGHSLIKDRMKKENALLGGEMSGHMFFRENWFGFDDALYAACKLIEIIEKSGRPLEEWLAKVPSYPSTPEIRLDCADSKKFEVVASVKAFFKLHHPVIELDGVRVLFAHGWGLVRASNTQPKLIVRAEAKTAEELEKIKQELLSVIERVMQSTR